MRTSKGLGLAIACACLAGIACGEGEPSQVSSGDQLALKADLCGAGIPDDVRDECERRCWLGATCDEVRAGRATEDTLDCLEDCPFVCDDGETIPGRWECDGAADCRDGSDEVGC